MILGWIRGQSRSLGFDLNPEVDLAFEGNVDRVAIPEFKDRQNILLHGTLVHERTHWLHFISTTSGVFHFAVWEAQALAAKQIITSLNGEVDVDSFPLRNLTQPNSCGETAQRVRLLVSAWIGLQSLQHWFFGNRAVFAARPPTRAAFELLSSFLRQWLIERYPGPDANQHARRYDLPNSFGQVSGVSGTVAGVPGKVSLGFYHLTECSARFNEVVAMQYGLDRKSDQLRIDTSYLREGAYGLARNRYYEVTGRELNHASEAILAVLVHESLNTSLPPLSPMAVFSEPWQLFHPYARFLSFTKLTKKYQPTTTTTLDVAAFTRIRSDVRAILLEGGLVSEDDTLCNHAQRIFGGFAGFQLPQNLYEIIDNRSYPVDYMRYRYLGRLFHDAFGLYNSEPGLVALPSLYYVTQRQRFRELFDPVRPPLLFIHNEGYRPTWEDPAAHAVLLLDTLVNEVLFAAMTCTYQDMIKELRSFIRHVKHQRHTMDAFRVALLNAGFSESFASKIAADAEA